MFTQPATLKEKNTFEIVLPRQRPKPITQSLTVERNQRVEGNTLHVSPEGQSDAKGTLDSPLDLSTAVDLLPRAERLS